MPATESNDQRFARLRVLVPNAVADHTLMVRIREGWTDQRIVTTDLAPQYSGRPAKQYRSRR